MAGSLVELLGGAEQREAFLHGDSKSGSAFERVVVHGEPRIVKYVHPDDDWTMRFFGEGCRPLEVWRSGLMDACPERIDHTVVAAAGGLGRDGLGAALVMRDVGPHLVPEGDAPLSVDLNRSLVTDMAALGASTWGWRDDLGLVSAERRWGAFTDAQLADEAARGWPNPVPRIAHDGWARFEAEAPAAARDLVLGLRRDLRPLVDAARTTPWCFLHGDWKLGNLGHGPDGRTILIDWTYCGSGPFCFDLGWYLALNAARLPESKEATIEVARGALEERGIDTGEWWDRQLGLCLLGTLVLFGWEKALGDPAELGWWCDRAVEGAGAL